MLLSRATQQPNKLRKIFKELRNSAVTSRAAIANKIRIGRQILPVEFRGGTGEHKAEKSLLPLPDKRSFSGHLLFYRTGTLPAGVPRNSAIIPRLVPHPTICLGIEYGCGASGPWRLAPNERLGSFVPT